MTLQKTPMYIVLTSSAKLSITAQYTLLIGTKKVKKTKKLVAELPTQRHGLKKKLAKLKKARIQEKNHKSGFKITSIASHYQEEDKKLKEKTILRENLETLAKFSKKKVSQEATEVILKRNAKVKRIVDKKDSIKEEKNSEENFKSIFFSDKDFEQWKKAPFIKSKRQEESEDDW